MQGMLRVWPGALGGAAQHTRPQLCVQCVYPGAWHVLGHGCGAQTATQLPVHARLLLQHRWGEWGAILLGVHVLGRISCCPRVQRDRAKAVCMQALCLHARLGATAAAAGMGWVNVFQWGGGHRVCLPSSGSMVAEQSLSGGSSRSSSMVRGTRPTPFERRWLTSNGPLIEFGKHSLHTRRTVTQARVCICCCRMGSAFVSHRGPPEQHLTGGHGGCPAAAWACCW